MKIMVFILLIFAARVSDAQTPYRIVNVTKSQLVFKNELTGNIVVVSTNNIRIAWFYFHGTTFNNPYNVRRKILTSGIGKLIYFNQGSYAEKWYQKFAVKKRLGIWANLAANRQFVYNHPLIIKRRSHNNLVHKLKDTINRLRKDSAEREVFFASALKSKNDTIKDVKLQVEQKDAKIRELEGKWQFNNRIDPIEILVFLCAAATIYHQIKKGRNPKFVF